MEQGTLAQTMNVGNRAPRKFAHKLCCLSLCAACGLGLIGTPAYADPAYYDDQEHILRIDSRTSPGSKESYDSAEGTFTGGGSWKWSKEESTLTLENVTNKVDGSVRGIFIWSPTDTPHDVNIKFKGKNSIYANSGGSPVDTFNLVGTGVFTFSGEGEGARLDVLAESDGSRGADPSAISITAPGGKGDTPPSLVFESGEIYLKSRILESDKKSVQSNGIFGAIKRIEIKKDAKLTIEAKVFDTDQSRGYSINSLHDSELIFASKHPTTLSADTGVAHVGEKSYPQPGLKARHYESGKNGSWSFSADAPVQIIDTGKGRVAFTPTLMEGFINSATEEYEVGFIDPALTVLQGNYPLYMVDSSRAGYISGAYDKNTASIGKIYTIDPSMVLADGSLYTPSSTTPEQPAEVSESPEQIAPPNIKLHKDQIPLVQRRPHNGKTLSAYPAGQSFSLEAPESLEDGRLIFSHWEGLDGIIAESDKTNPSLLVTMPEKRIEPKAVYMEPKPEPEPEPVEPQPDPQPEPVDPQPHPQPVEPQPDPQPQPEPVDPEVRPAPQPAPQEEVHNRYPSDINDQVIIDQSPRNKVLPKTGDHSVQSLAALLSLGALSLFCMSLAAKLRSFRKS